jgi:hypothetical protein
MPCGGGHVRLAVVNDWPAHALFDLQKNEPKSLKNLSRAQNCTPASSAPCRASPRGHVTPPLVKLGEFGPARGLKAVDAERGRTRPFARRVLVGAIEAE